MASPVPLLSLPFAELAERIGPGRARAIYRVLRCGRDPLAELPRRSRARVLEHVSGSATHVAAIHASQDGTAKLLVELRDGLRVESVVIPGPDRTTLCVSSQVGCARGCVFCLTATMGLGRNLTCDEILSQVVHGIRVVEDSGRPPVRNVVYMGMGEPLDNLENVARSLALLTQNEALGIGSRHVTVSTVGTTERAIREASAWPGHLAWSLHAADDALRRRLIPTARRPVEALRDDFISALSEVGAPLFAEVVLIDDVNDALEHASSIVRLFRGAPIEIRINLLPLNPTGSNLAPSRAARVEEFRRAIQDEGYFCTVRRPRGGDEGAACGQLAVGRSRPSAKPAISS